MQWLLLAILAFALLPQAWGNLRAAYIALRPRLASWLGAADEALDRRWLTLMTMAFFAGVMVTLAVQRAPIRIDWPDWIPDVVIVDPPPIPGDGLKIVVIEETEHRGQYTRGQLDIIAASGPGSLRDYALQNCVSINGQPAFRVLDKDNLDVSRDQEWVRHAVESASGRLADLPLVIVSNGRSGEIFQAKPNAQDTIATVQKYGGRQ